jgi:hypothetical protein
VGGWGVKVPPLSSVACICACVRACVCMCMRVRVASGLMVSASKAPRLSSCVHARRRVRSRVHAHVYASVRARACACMLPMGGARVRGCGVERAPARFLRGVHLCARACVHARVHAVCVRVCVCVRVHASGASGWDHVGPRKYGGTEPTKPLRLWRLKRDTHPAGDLLLIQAQAQASPPSPHTPPHPRTSTLVKAASMGPSSRPMTWFADVRRRSCAARASGRCWIPYKYLALRVTDRFGPTVGRKILKRSGNKKTAWGNRQVEHIKFAAASASRGAPWRRPSVARSRRRVARSRHALRESRTMIGYNRLSTPADLASSFFNQIKLRKRWIPLATAHTPVCSARNLVCARPRTATWRF